MDYYDNISLTKQEQDAYRNFSRDTLIIIACTAQSWINRLNKELREAKEEIARLKEYEYMYKELCK